MTTIHPPCQPLGRRFRCASIFACCAVRVHSCSVNPTWKLVYLLSHNAIHSPPLFGDFGAHHSSAQYDVVGAARDQTCRVAVVYASTSDLHFHVQNAVSRPPPKHFHRRLQVNRSGEQLKRRGGCSCGRYKTIYLVMFHNSAWVTLNHDANLARPRSNEEFHSSQIG